MRGIKFKVSAGQTTVGYELLAYGTWKFKEVDGVWKFGTFGNKAYKRWQYTGQKDKNGKEIYEGDIVEAEHISRPMVVFYSQDRVAFKLGHQGDKTQYDKQENLWPDECKVIGSIHENPELLEK